MPNRQRFLRKEKPFLLFRLESWCVSNVPDDFSFWENRLLEERSSTSDGNLPIS